MIFLTRKKSEIIATPPPPLSNLGWPSATPPEFGRVWRACTTHITYIHNTYTIEQGTHGACNLLLNVAPRAKLTTIMLYVFHVLHIIMYKHNTV